MRLCLHANPSPRSRHRRTWRSALWHRLPIGLLDSEMRAETRQVSDYRVEPVIEDILAVGHAEKALLYEQEHRSRDWKRPGLALAGLLAGAEIIGTIAGLSAGGSTNSQAAVTVPLPAATSHPDAVPSEPAQAASPTASDAEAAEAISVPAAPPVQRHRLAIASKVPILSPSSRPPRHRLRKTRRERC